MSALNPERVFRIQHPGRRPARALARAARGARRGGSGVQGAAARRRQRDPSRAREPVPARARSWSSSLARAAELARTEKAGLARLSRAGAGLPRPSASDGRYRVRDGSVEAIEFTAIYPAGTIDGTTTYKGETLPAFGVTGVWPLIRRDEGPRSHRDGGLPLAQPRLRLHHHAAVRARRRHRLQRLPQRRRALRPRRHAVPAERLAQGDGRARSARSPTRTSGSSAAGRRRTAARGWPPAT